MTSQRPARAVILSGHDLGAWRRDFAVGAVPSELPYGADAIARAGLSLSVRSPWEGPLGRRLRAKVEHRTGYGVQAALSAAPAIARADLTIALLEREGAMPAILKRWRIPPYASTPLVVWSCWLADDLQRADPERRQRLFERLRAADLVTHLSRHETSILVEAGFREDQLLPVTYGVSHRYYVPGPDEERDIELLAVGQDRGRDYATLMDAMRGTDLQLELVCRPENLAGIDVPDNVSVRGPVPLPVYRDLLRRAKVVAVPTRELAYPTGSSVALEAASSGCCVVATRTTAMADYVDDRRSGRLVDVGDARGWRRTLQELREDTVQRRSLAEVGRRRIVDRFNADRMWQEVVNVARHRGLV